MHLDTSTKYWAKITSRTQQLRISTYRMSHPVPWVTKSQVICEYDGECLDGLDLRPVRPLQMELDWLLVA